MRYSDLENHRVEMSPIDAIFCFSHQLEGREDSSCRMKPRLDRFQKTLDLFRRYSISRIICTDVYETWRDEMMAKNELARREGIDVSKILHIPAITSDCEEIESLVRTMHQLKLKSLVVLASHSHLAEVLRALQRATEQTRIEITVCPECLERGDESRHAIPFSVT
jgi:hypothetical protein